jgi:serine/threonine protein phosphatase 1
MKESTSQSQELGSGRLFAIGDIHGSSIALAKLIEAIDPQSEDTIVVLGDAIDCGADSKGVLDQLITLANRCHLVALLGNHEGMLLKALDSPSEFKRWLADGGEQTLRSYSSAIRPGPEVIPAEHIRFIRGFRSYFETPDFIFVHAGCDPNLQMDRQSAEMLRWASVLPARMVPHVSGKVVIAGHTRQKSGEVLDLGFLKILDTDSFGGGFLTALEVHTGQIFQANQLDQLRRSAGTPA